jgi:hypothetical protein
MAELRRTRVHHDTVGDWLIDDSETVRLCGIQFTVGRKYLNKSWGDAPSRSSHYCDFAYILSCIRLYEMRDSMGERIALFKNQ